MLSTLCFIWLHIAASGTGRLYTGTELNLVSKGVSFLLNSDQLSLIFLLTGDFSLIERRETIIILKY